MRRYVTKRPRMNIEWAEDWEYAGNHTMETNVTVFEKDNHPIPTGLLDANGVELYAVDERDPIGFDLTTRG